MYTNNCNNLSVNFQKRSANRVLYEIRGVGDYFQARGQVWTGGGVVFELRFKG